MFEEFKISLVNYKYQRENMIREQLKTQAYYDGSISIGSGQTTSQPYVIALMAQTPVLFVKMLKMQNKEVHHDEN